MDILKLFVALCATNKSIDIVTKNRTFQVSGHPQMQGMWQRHFKAGQYPTRSNISKTKAQWALDHAKKIKLWVGPLEFRVVTEAELAKELAPFPIGEVAQ